MPNRIDARINGIRPAMARERPQQANAGEQTAQRMDAGQADNAASRVDRVEIAGADRAGGAQDARATAPERDEQRGAALDAAGARPTEAGRQGTAEDAAAQRAEQLREQQQADAQRTEARPAQRQGNLVDVTA